MFDVNHKHLLQQYADKNECEDDSDESAPPGLKRCFSFVSEDHGLSERIQLEEAVARPVLTLLPLHVFVVTHGGFQT